MRVCPAGRKVMDAVEMGAPGGTQLRRIIDAYSFSHALSEHLGARLYIKRKVQLTMASLDLGLASRHDRLGNIEAGCFSFFMQARLVEEEDQRHYPTFSR